MTITGTVVGRTIVKPPVTQHIIVTGYNINGHTGNIKGSILGIGSNNSGFGELITKVQRYHGIPNENKLRRRINNLTIVSTLVNEGNLRICKCHPVNAKVIQLKIGVSVIPCTASDILVLSGNRRDRRCICLGAP